jgi:hypothetical protein
MSHIRNATAQRPIAVATICVVLAAMVGCGESQVEVFPVTGNITVDGKPPVGAQIVFHPVEASQGAEGVAPIGTVKSDGSFDVTVYQPGDGAPPGAYIATIQWFPYDEKIGGAGRNVIPDEYSSPKTSPIKVTVKGGASTTLDPIKIVLAKTAGVPRRTF